jgi:hypothetical protein
MTSQGQIPTVHRNPQISTMIEEISIDSLEQYMDRLIGFGTRNIL